MFEDSLVESSGKLGRRSPWTLAFSFAAQMLIAGVLVLFPLVYMEALPEQHLLGMLEAPAPPPPGAPASPKVSRSAAPVSELDHGELRLPARIPKTIAIDPDEEAALSDDAAVRGVPKGVSNSLITQLIPNSAAAVPRVVVQKLRVSSGVAQGLLVYEVKPQYPTLARQARIQGTVVLQAVIGKDGTVQNLHVVTGHPMLITSAIEAVKQWRYKPYYLNGEPIDVDTQISVNFILAGE